MDTFQLNTLTTNNEQVRTPNKQDLQKTGGRLQHEH